MLRFGPVSSLRVRRVARAYRTIQLLEVKLAATGNPDVLDRVAEMRGLHAQHTVDFIDDELRARGIPRAERRRITRAIARGRG